MSKPRVGLLGLYLELYDRVLPDVRLRIDSFYQTITSELEKRGLEVVTNSVCRLKPEFEAAVKSFEGANVDAIVTLHLAYSPSLESAPVVAKTKLPVIICDTTQTWSYSPEQDPIELMYNHGIHGVQDFCNLLIREGKPFEIAVGHWEESDVLDQVADLARTARLATRMRTARIGLIGRQFAGMGDFQVPEDILRETIGMEVVHADFGVLKSLMPAENDPTVEAEMAADRERFFAEGIDLEAHRNTTRVCLAVRLWMEQENLSGFTMNFEDINRSTGLLTVPFLEASKANARGMGYAGEGDVLTAAFVGALASVFPETSFTEMFCPDWENDAIFLSHMGELNVDLVSGKATLLPKKMPWVDADTSVVAVGCFKGGDAVFVNLAPGPDNTYTLIIAPVEMLDVECDDRMQDAVRGWFTPSMPLTDFLKEYSVLGGTHHAALVYGDVITDLIRFGNMMDWDIAVLG